MTTWGDFAADAPQLAAVVEDRLLAHRHHVLGTVGPDGGPRLHGITIGISDGQLWFGCMPQSLKVRDLQRDARVALHSAPLDPELIRGDCRILGRAVALSSHTVRERQLSDIEGEFFTIDVELVHLVEVVDEQLRLTSWKSGRGLRIVNRS